METKVCPQCNIEFQAYPSQRRKFCSAACRVAAGVAVKKTTGRYKPCEACGTEFWVVPAREATARFCSRTCKDGDKALFTEHTCVQCGAKFDAWPSQRRRYCSKPCASKHKTFRKGSPCETCGKTVDPLRNQNRFCSLACAHVATRTGEMVPCAECGKPTYKRPNEIRIHQDNFCSRDCANKSQRLVGPGKTMQLGSGYVCRYYPSHPDASSSGVIAEHRWVAEQMLGRRLRKSEHVHHINGVKNDNRPENLEVLEAGEHTRRTVKEATAKRRTEAAELAAYRAQFGPL